MFDERGGYQPVERPSGRRAPEYVPLFEQRRRQEQAEAERAAAAPPQPQTWAEAKRASRERRDAEENMREVSARTKMLAEIPAGSWGEKINYIKQILRPKIENRRREFDEYPGDPGEEFENSLKADEEALVNIEKQFGIKS
jgi:hypothetical protein